MYKSDKPYLRAPQFSHRLLRQDGRYTIDGHHVVNCTSDFWKWQTSGERRDWPARVENRRFPHPPARVDGADIAITWIGHATALIQTGGRNIMTDPFFSERASPVQWAGPRRVRDPGMALQDLPPLDLILVSHNHYDHMDLPALEALAHNHDAPVLTPSGNARTLSGAVPAGRIAERTWHEPLDLGGGLSVTPTPALHWSKRGLRDRNRALWAAFMIETRRRRIYFAADTGFGSGAHFSETRDHYGAPDVALIPIGAYEPRWFMKAQHINPDEAVRAHKLLGARHSIAIHHATIQLTDEAIDAPVRDLRKARSRHGITDRHFIDLDVGETWRTTGVAADTGHAVYEAE